MVNGPFPHPATVAVEHTDLMLLGTPINPYKPLVWHRLIIALERHGGRYSKAHNFLSSLSRVFFSDDLPWMSLSPVRVLDAQLPTRGIPTALSLACTSFAGTLGAGLSGYCEREDHQGLILL